MIGSVDPSWSLDTVMRWIIHYPYTRSSGVYPTPTHESAYWAQLLFSGVLLEPLVIHTKEFGSGSRGCLVFQSNVLLVQQRSCFDGLWDSQSLQIPA
jgi:hypothetical protein